MNGCFSRQFAQPPKVTWALGRVRVSLSLFSMAFSAASSVRPLTGAQAVARAQLNCSAGLDQVEAFDWLLGGRP